MTGAHLPGTLRTVEPRTSQLAELHAQTFGPAAVPRDLIEDAGLGTEYIDPPRPVTDVPDDDLLDAARTAANGDKFTRLWVGETSGYGSHSEADQALCNLLAFWTQRDAGRMDHLFRRSGLYRAKWNRADYRTRTIERAVATTVEVYKPLREIPEAALEPGASTVDLDAVSVGEL